MLISTYGRAGIDRTAALRLPEVKEAGYLVGWQRGGDNGPVPQALIRPDMIVVESDTRGLAANRNMLLRRAPANYVISFRHSTTIPTPTYSSAATDLPQATDRIPHIHFYCRMHQKAIGLRRSRST